jgi:hypothetical protein
LLEVFLYKIAAELVCCCHKKKPKFGQKVPTFTTGFGKTRQNNIATIL